MSGVATAIVGGAVIGAVATNAAAKKQAGAAQAGIDAQSGQYYQTREDQTQWRDAGGKAIDQLSNLTQPGNQFGPDSKFTYNQLYADPSYQFRLDQGMKAIQRSAAARGGLMSGGTIKGLTDYAQGAASQEYQGAYSRWNNDQTQAFNRLASIAGLGQTATQSTAQAGANAANNISNLYTQQGNAQAGGIMGISNSFNNGMNTWMQYQMLQKLGK